MPVCSRRSRIGRQRKALKRSVSIQSAEISSVEVADSSFWKLPYLDNADSNLEVSSNFETIDDEELIDLDGDKANEFILILDKPCVYNPSKTVESVINDHNLEKYNSLKRDCFALREFVEELNYLFFTSSKLIKFIQLYDSQSPKVKLCVTILHDFSAELHVHNVLVNSDHDLWNTDTFTTKESILQLLTKISTYKVCCGNPDPHLQSIFQHSSNTTSGFKEIDYSVYYDNSGFAYNSTIRSSKCSMLIDNWIRCKNCSVYRKTIKKKEKRFNSKIPTPDKNWLTSRKGNSRLSDSEKNEKLKQIRVQNRVLHSQVAVLQNKLENIIKSNGVELTDSDAQDMSALMNQSSELVENAYPDKNSFQRLFWDQQLQFNSLQSKNGMRWHPFIIRWCIYLKMKSSSAYEALRTSGFINLPSERTLFDYSHVLKHGVGFNASNMESLINEINLKNLNEDWKKYVGILQDEIKIQSDLVYDKTNGELVGFIDLDSVGNDLLKIEEVVRNENQKLAKHVLVVMVRGVASDLKFPFAHFATGGVTADKLFTILWKTVEILEVNVGLKVIFITSDGAAANRSFIKLHKLDDNTNEVVYRAVNRFAEDDRFIYFISDPPHLLKTARNCFSNSHSHKNTRNLWKDGKDISWMHIVNLYNDHCSGIYRVCPKLSKAHIDISSYGCMKVNLAAQVLSSTVANALEMFYGDNVSETVVFIRHMNRFFDCLNTRNLNEAKWSRNEDLKPFTDAEDPRLGFLLNDFLDYFKEWKSSVEQRHPDATKSQKAAMQLSFQTLEGFQITVKSVVECIRYMLSNGVPFILTEHFNQDPIEQHFGIHRTSGGSNSNPSLAQFNHSMNKVRTAGSHALAPFCGNTKRRLPMERVIDNTPLPKRRNQPE